MVEAEDEHRRGRKSPWAAEVDGFNIHAGVLIHAGDREGLERLCRYGARPPFSLERISLLTDGRIAYLLKKPRSNGATHLVMTPVQFLARIATLIPPPRFPLQRFSGVLAPNSPWRPAVVAMRPAVPTPSSAAEPRPAAPRPKKKAKKKNQDATSDVVFLPAANDAPSAPTLALGPRTSLGGGLVPASPDRLDWASLIRRVFLHDVLACPCGARRRIVADLNEPHAIEAILGHLGLPSQAPPVARAREPLARGRVYTGAAAKAAGLVDVLGGFDVALREVRAQLPAEIREALEPHDIRAPRRALPIVHPPLEGEAGRRAASAILGALLPMPERAIVELAAAGDRVLMLWTGGAAGC